MIKSFKFILINFSLIPSLFSDTIIFNDGLLLNGKLINITDKHPYDPNTGSEQEVIFKVENYNLKRVPEKLVINKSDDNVFMFDINEIYKIENEYGMTIYSSNQKFIRYKQPPKAINIKEFKLISSELTLSNGSDFVNIPLSSEMNLNLHEPASINPLDMTAGIVNGALNGMLMAGPFGAFVGAGAMASAANSGTTSIMKAKYKGIAVDTSSNENYFLTNKGAIELTNISGIGYIESYESKALESFLIGTGVFLAPGGLLLLAGQAMEQDGIGFIFTGVCLVLYSPINGISKAIEKWKIPNIKYFDINDNAWSIDKDIVFNSPKKGEQN